MVYCVFCSVATFPHGRDNELPIRVLAGIYQGRRVCGRERRRPYSRLRIGHAGVDRPVGLARADVYDGGDASDPPHPPDPLSNGPRVWANVCDLL